MNVVELVVVVLTAILELSVASVISAGLSKTCDAFEKIDERLNHHHL